MRFVSPLLKHVVYPSLAKAGMFRRNGEGLSIVTYHGVLPEGYRLIDPALDGSLVTEEMFRRQLRLLKTNYNVISPEMMRRWCEGKAELPERALLITCDDGLVNGATQMLPALRDEAVACLFFVIGLSAEQSARMLWYEELYLMLAAARSGRFSVVLDEIEVAGVVGTQNKTRALWRDLTMLLEGCDGETCMRFLDAIRAQLELSGQFVREYLADAIAEQRFRLLGPRELHMLLAAGMSIGAHTLTHPMLSRLPEESAWFEISEGRRRLEEVLGRKVWAFAYPFGGPIAVSEREFAMVERAGYEAAFLSFGGGFGSVLPRYALPRIHITGDMGLSELEAHVSGFYRSLRTHLGREQRIAGLSAA